MEVLREGRKDVHFFKENKYAFKCKVCGAVFIVDEHEFHGGRWETEDNKGFWGYTVKCPTCGNVTADEWGTKLRTNIDEEHFRKELEQELK